jgi:hypothetical protein
MEGTESWMRHLFSKAQNLMKRFVGEKEAIYVNLHMMVPMFEGPDSLLEVRRYHMANFGLEKHDKMLEAEVVREDIEDELIENIFHISILGNYGSDYVYTTKESAFLEAEKITCDAIEGVYEHTYMDPPVEDGERMKAIIWAWLEECIKQKLAADRIGVVKEELVATAWRPERVAAWLEAGVALEEL